MSAVGAATLYFVDQDVRSTQEDRMKRTVGDISAEAAAHGGALPGEPASARVPDDTARTYDIGDGAMISIYDRSGRRLQHFPPESPLASGPLLVHPPDAAGNEEVRLLRLPPSGDDRPLLAAVAPIRVSGEVAGYALYAMREENVVPGILKFQLPRLILFTTGVLSGWAVIYWMTRLLVRPIQEVGAAAKQIVAGQYDVRLDVDHQTKEISELQASFREMAERLHKLETLRTQLLAGVTHELKTPVTSISGLVQAVRSGVVSGEEAEAFLTYCLKETGRLQSMIEDLLDFNSFAAGAVTVSIESVHLKEWATAAVDKWRLGRERGDHVPVEVIADDAADWRGATDPVRLEQIVVNLLNNAAAALAGADEGRIRVCLFAEPGGWRIEVQDTGSGIPEEEREDVFLPFFRGKEKRATVRGLGLGLSFSRLVARSLGGDLTLTSTGPEGTVMTVVLPDARPEEAKP